MVVRLPVPFPSGTPWAFFLDLDGTLLELADHPDNVIVPEGLKPLLVRLRTLLGGALAVVSGRSLATIDLLLGGSELDAAGCHGAETRFNGRLETLVATDAFLPDVAGRLVTLTENIALTMVEIKPHSIALHYRPAVIPAAQARHLCKSAMGERADKLRLLDGKQVVEILPREGGKGVAIAHFMERPPYFGRLPVFVGDDVTDEEGFLEVNARAGISIRVGDGATSAARYRLGSVAEVLDWLAGPVCVGLGASQS